jgi:3',5'-cyclic AMP phosphodiesterase CpdA
LRAESDHDWLIVAGDVAEVISEIEWALRVLRDRFPMVIWVPGNHELWTPPHDPVMRRGQARYHHLVDLCRSLGVISPEDVYPVWRGPGGPARIAPLFLLYDYTFRVEGTDTKEAGKHGVMPGSKRPNNGCLPATRTCRWCWSTIGR